MSELRESEGSAEAVGRERRTGAAGIFLTVLWAAGVMEGR